MSFLHVKLSELDQALPADIARVDVAGRAAQLAERLRTYRLRPATN